MKIYDGVVKFVQAREIEKNTFKNFMRRHHVFFLGCGVKESFIKQIWEWTREEDGNKNNI
jgi:hypothetical protein